MKKGIVYAFTSLLYIFLMIQVVYAAGHIPLKGERFPDVDISAPEKTIDKNYLGLTGPGTFKIPQIKGDMVILEIFNTYCPYCQRETPFVNDLYQRINNDTALKNRIKMFGIGIGNTSLEVNVFRDQYHVLFPLIPDESFSAHKAVGEVRTPYFFVIRMNPDGPNKLIYSKVGSIQDAKQFLDMILHEAGLK
jgi:thiol-disulfide isomerase/thioredoxin